MYRYLTNEAVTLMNRIVVESSSLCFVDFLLFSSFVFRCCFFCNWLLWDSENNISTTSVALSVVIPVRLVWWDDGRRVDAACACVDEDRFIWKFNFRTVFPTFVLSIPRCMMAHVWSYSTPRTVTVSSILDGLSPSDLVLAVHYTRLVVV